MRMSRAGYIGRRLSRLFDQSPHDCDHGASRMTRYPMDMTAVRGWLFFYVMCWRCDLRVRIGWRWNFRSVGHAVRWYQEHGGWR